MSGPIVRMPFDAYVLAPLLLALLLFGTLAYPADTLSPEKIRKTVWHQAQKIIFV